MKRNLVYSAVCIVIYIFINGFKGTQNSTLGRMIVFNYFPNSFQMDIIRILVLIIPLLIFIGSYLQKEWFNSKISIVLRFGNYRNWYKSIVIFITSITLLYLLILLLVEWIIASLLRYDENLLQTIELFQNTSPTFITYIWQTIFFLLSILLIVTCFVLFIVIVRNTMIATIGVLVLLLFSFTLISFQPQLIVYFPWNYFASGLLEKPIINLVILVLSIIGVNFVSLLIFNKKREFFI